MYIIFGINFAFHPVSWNTINHSYCSRLKADSNIVLEEAQGKKSLEINPCSIIISQSIYIFKSEIPFTD